MQNETVEIDTQWVVQKLRDLRKTKGFSIENMAEELHISVAAYNKIEKQNTKLTLERLFQIRKILNIPLEELFGIECRIFYHHEIKDNEIVNEDVQILNQEIKDLYDKLIQVKDEEIALLKSMLSRKRAG